MQDLSLADCKHTNQSLRHPQPPNLRAVTGQWLHPETVMYCSLHTYN